MIPERLKGLVYGMPDLGSYVVTNGFVKKRLVVVSLPVVVIASDGANSCFSASDGASASHGASSCGNASGGASPCDGASSCASACSCVSASGSASSYVSASSCVIISGGAGT